jgi:hypothetical protein
MNNFGMELQPPDLSSRVAGRRNHAAGSGQNLKSLRQRVNPVAMTHPSLKLRRDIFPKHVRLGYIYESLAELAPVTTRYYPSSEAVRDQLQAIADSQRWHTESEKLGRKRRAPLSANRIGASRQNNPAGLGCLDFVQGCIIGSDLAVYG